ncbi:hypothetical protein [uncultured Thiodictyon sp.]|uniref:hypothetical protein n=1 Tax=uncultured Thiodictyon sp. TaxID=1846217 RepID=UPI00260013C9|nr:hypothetical protein [uncultured Thiodictyon sp.]
MTRQTLSKNVERELEKYYGGKRCVVTKVEFCEYHHIDDDDTNTSFVNLVPLASTFNSPKLRDARKHRSKSVPVVLPAQLDPQALLHQANLHFSQWHISLAYGCARLAHFVGMNYLGFDEEARLPFACMAMYFARHSVNYALIRDILIRDFIPVAKSGCVSSEMRVLIIQELAGIFSENGRQKESLGLYQLIPDSVSKATHNISSAKYAALLRRKATSIIAGNGPTDASASLLTDARGSDLHSENLTASIANTLAWACLASGDYKGVVELLEPLRERYVNAVFTASDRIKPIAITAWNAAEVFHSYAVAAAHLGKNYVARSNEALVHAAQIYKHCGTYPFGFRPDFWSKEKQIHKVAHDRGVATVDFLPRIPADIDATISQLVNWLIW